MRKLIKIFLSLLICAVVVHLQSCDNTNKGLMVSAIVTFGQQPPGGGQCAGNGICMASASNSLPRPAGTPVNFTVDPADNTMLLMTFKITDLQGQPQPEQQQQARDILAATAPSAPQPARYQWVGVYQLSTNSMYTSLNLKPGAKITPITPITITFDGTTVVLHIKYDHV